MRATAARTQPRGVALRLSYAAPRATDGQCPRLQLPRFDLGLRTKNPCGENSILFRSHSEPLSGEESASTMSFRMASAMRNLLVPDNETKRPRCYLWLYRGAAMPSLS